MLVRSEAAAEAVLSKNPLESSLEGPLTEESDMIGNKGDAGYRHSWRHVSFEKITESVRH